MRPLFRAAALALALTLAAASALLCAQEKKPAPKLLVAFPIGVELGKKSTINLRGLNLEHIKTVHAEPAGVVVTIETNGTTAVPNNTSKETLGDTQARIAFTLPKDFAGDRLLLRVETDGGRSEPLTVPVLREGAFIAEKEENNAFKTAQPLTLPARVAASIRSAQDVDVYVLQGKAGQELNIEVFAHRGGSLCDAVLTLRDERLSLLASDDDSAGGRDPRLQLRLPADGKYFLIVQDAHDTGDEMHPYHLLVR
ncbi:MAG: hypothetical protein EXS19_04935 [Pedosphaera sp.]|nr:hypothetical protein [Pedosphaera sp.]MSU41240.1 hypothetical protein [Pedosphaera sp.]